MTLAEFHNALRILASIDMRELVHAGAISGDDTGGWQSFRDNPWRWFIRADDDTATAVWRIIESRQPKKPDARMAANVHLIAQAPAMAEALEAHHAWSYAEHHSLGCFEARGVLCAHAESLTARALAAIRGDAVPDYKGRRSLTIWPAVEITESDEATARALVAEVLEHERAALSPYTPAAPEMPKENDHAG